MIYRDDCRRRHSRRRCQRIEIGRHEIGERSRSHNRFDIGLIIEVPDCPYRLLPRHCQMLPHTCNASPRSRRLAEADMALSSQARMSS